MKYDIPKHTKLRNKFQVVSFNKKFILLLSRHNSNHTFRKLNTTDDLFTQEVTDLKQSKAIRVVKGYENLLQRENPYLEEQC